MSGDFRPLLIYYAYNGDGADFSDLVEAGQQEKKYFFAVT
jgi:hypothetical protein